jgi:hypothetical protein
MLRFACRKGRWILDPTSVAADDLAAEISQIIKDHRTCWLARNRPGGLDDSAARLGEHLDARGRLAIPNPQP